MTRPDPLPRSALITNSGETLTEEAARAAIDRIAVNRKYRRKRTFV